jgi:DNA-directed RNA polymerase subunit RPC12/RpoP
MNEEIETEVEVEIDPREKELTYYCKECKEVVEIHRDGKKDVFNCKKCGGKNIVYGTLKSIKDFFHLKNI